MIKQIGLSCCSISSIPLDYEGNKLKIIESIKKCKQLKCNIRIGGELEICGVNCKDSFKEIEDLNENCWFYLSEILKEKYNNEYLTENILCFIGMPVYFKQKLHNCEVVIYNNEIILIIPKERVNNYERKNYFSPYLKCSYEEEKCDINKKEKIMEEITFKNSNVKFFNNNLENLILPNCIQRITKQKETYIGNAVIQLNSLIIAHFFLDDLIKIQNNLICDNNRNSMLSENNSRLLEKKELLFQRDFKKLSINDIINFECIDILLVNGYISNEIHLFKKYFIELMKLTEHFPNLTLCFSNNSGCDNNFYKYDGFSFVSKNKKILTKNARFSFSEIQVASINVSFNKEEKRIDMLHKAIGKKYSLLQIKENNLLKEENAEENNKNNRTNYDECIFSFNEELNISIKASHDTLSNYLPSNFNWFLYAQKNIHLLQLFNNFHHNSNEYFYEFNSKKYALHNTYEELSFNCALFLWHILHLTKAKGFMLAISGGIDSSFVACIIYILSIMIEINLNKKKDMSNITNLELDDKLFFKKIKHLLIDKYCRKDICNKLLNTISLPSKNSSDNTKLYSELLSKSINSYHTVYNIDNIYEFFKSAGEDFLKEDLKYKSEGGSNYQDICLQNIQSRSRMLLTYFFSTLICHKRYSKLNLHNEFIITLATGNLDESVTGYYTKYDCSSGDINIIGNISKILIKETMCYIANDSFYDLKILNEINQYHPTAELKPLINKQIDENELNITYLEIKLLCILKNNFFLGPYSMFFYLSNYFWKDIPKILIFEKIKNFLTRILKNTHKLFILPPSIINESCGLHLSNYIHYANVDFEKLKKKLNL